MKHLFRKTGWLCMLSVILFTGCQQDAHIFMPDESSLNSGKEKAAIAGYNYLANTNGIFVLAEGTMTSENGTLSYVDATGSSSGSFSAQNWVYGDPKSGYMGNVSQNGNSYTSTGTRRILVLDNKFVKTREFNPGDYFPNGWSGSGPTPTHLAVSGNTIYIRTNSGIMTTSESTSDTPPTPIAGIVKPSRTRMAMVKNSGVKYLYVGSEQGTLYRINTSTNAVSNITLSGKIAGVVAVRRNNNADQYIYALSIVSSNQAILYKISGTTIDASYTINSSFDAGLLIPSVGLCCYAGGAQDILYFRSNGWNPTQIFKYVITSTTAGSLSTLYTVPNGINPSAQIIYGDLVVDQSTSDVYFGYVGNWSVYAKVNGVGQLKGGNSSSIQEYKANGTGASKIDTGFTTAIYFTREFDI